MPIIEPQDRPSLSNKPETPWLTCLVVLYRIVDEGGALHADYILDMPHKIGADALAGVIQQLSLAHQQLQRQERHGRQ